MYNRVMRIRAKHFGIPIDVPPVGLDQPGVMCVICSCYPASDRMYIQEHFLSRQPRQAVAAVVCMVKGACYFKTL